MSDAKDVQSPVSVDQKDVAKKEAKKPSKKMKSSTVKDVISRTRTMTGSPPDQININPFQEAANHEKTAVMTFGNFNPPTSSDEKLIKEVEKTAAKSNGSAHIVASHLEGDMKNPLALDKKVEYLKKLASNGTYVYGASKAQPSILHHAAALHKHAHHLIVVTRKNDVQKSLDLLNKNNGKEGSNFNFKSIQVIPSETEGNEDDVSNMRKHAMKNDENAFRGKLPKALHSNAGEIMKQIQKVTGVEKVKKEETELFVDAVQNFIKENTNISNKQMNALEIKSLKSGIDLDIILETYCYAYQTAVIAESKTHTPEQIGFNAVNSLIANSLFDVKKDVNELFAESFKDTTKHFNKQTGHIRQAIVKHINLGLSYWEASKAAKLERMKNKEFSYGIATEETQEITEGDIVDLGKKREEEGLKKFHKGFMSDIQDRVAKKAKILQAHKEAGKFPFEIGTRFSTEHSRKNKQPPFKVKGYYADTKDPENHYGYHVERDMDGGKEETQLAIKHPKLEKLHGPKKWAELQAGFQEYKPLKSVKEENLNEISDELVGRINKLRSIGSGTEKPRPHKTAAGAQTLRTAVNKVRFNSKVGAPPSAFKENINFLFNESLKEKNNDII